MRCIIVEIPSIICSSVTEISGVEGFGIGGDTSDNGITFGNSRRSTSFWDDVDDDDQDF